MKSGLRNAILSTLFISIAFSGLSAIADDGPIVRQPPKPGQKPPEPPSPEKPKIKPTPAPAPKPAPEKPKDKKPIPAPPKPKPAEPNNPYDPGQDQDRDQNGQFPTEPPAPDQDQDQNGQYPAPDQDGDQNGQFPNEPDPNEPIPQPEPQPEPRYCDQLPLSVECVTELADPRRAQNILDGNGNLTYAVIGSWRVSQVLIENGGGFRTIRGINGDSSKAGPLDIDHYGASFYDWGRAGDTYQTDRIQLMDGRVIRLRLLRNHIFDNANMTLDCVAPEGFVGEKLLCQWLSEQGPGQFQFRGFIDLTKRK